MRSVVEEFGEFVLSWRIGVEDKGAVGVEGDFPGFPGFEGFPKLALVRVEVRRPVRDLEFELRGIGFFGFPPAPFGLGTDGFEGLDVERRAGRWGYREEAFLNPLHPRSARPMKPTRQSNFLAISSFSMPAFFRFLSAVASWNGSNAKRENAVSVQAMVFIGCLLRFDDSEFRIL